MSALGLPRFGVPVISIKSELTWDRHSAQDLDVNLQHLSIANLSSDNDYTDKYISK